MKSIIAGKRYDTETATKIGEASYNGSRRDFEWWEETLYRTPRSGTYFTVGSGGPRSNYARAEGQNSWTGQSNVFRPLTPAQALAWAERHLSAADVEAHFGGQIEDA